MNKQVLNFPLPWEYRVFVEAEQSEQVRSALVFLLKNYVTGAVVRCGNVSGNGKYRILIAEVLLQNREIMDQISADMSKLPGVRYVL